MENAFECPKCNYSDKKFFSVCPNCGNRIEQNISNLEKKLLSSAPAKAQRAQPVAEQPSGGEKPKGQSATTGLLVIIMLLLAANFYLQIEARMQRYKDTSAGTEIIEEFEKSRAQIVEDYVDAMNIPETQTLYQQLYLTNNAQFKMMNLMMQQNQLLIEFLSKKQ